jgi:ankyrin repeat protein
MPPTEPSEQSDLSPLESAMSYLSLDPDNPYKDLDPETALLQAVKEERLDIVTNLLERGVDADTRDGKGRTSLFYAAELGHVEIVSRLIQKGASPNTQDDEGQTVLFRSSVDGHVEVMSLLLGNGAEVDVADEEGWTPLMVASEQGHDEAVALLLEHGADPNARDNDEFTAILQAASGGHPDIVARLLDAGADPNVQDEADGLTAISRAAEQGNADVIKLLLERGVDPNVDDRILLSALHGFSRDDISGSHAVMEMLVQHGADVFMDCWTDERPLVIAARQGRFLNVEMFLEASCSSSSVRQEHIWEAITVAAEGGEGAILASLMKHYDPDETEKQTPWEWVKEYQFGQSYELLQPYFEPDAKSDKGRNGSD